MAAGDLISSDWQVEFDGLLMGAGTCYGIASVDGLNMPELRSGSDVDQPQGHGQVPGNVYMKARDIAVSLEVDSNASNSLLTLLNTLGSSTNPSSQSEIPLVIQLPVIGKVRTNARVYKSVFPTDYDVGLNVSAKANVLFHASDPRWYANAASTGSASGGVTTGGLGFPHAFPHGFGSATPGTIAAANSGNFDTYPTFTVTVAGAGISDFTIQNLTTGATFSMTLAMVAGDHIDLDFLAKTALLGGTASRAANVNRPGSSWFALQPGTNDLSFSYSGAGTATLAASWRSAWVF